MTDKTDLNNITNLIIAAFEAKYPSYNIGDYDEEEDGGVDTPAILIQLENFEKAGNPIPDLFRVNCTFRAYVCESYKGKAKRRVRDTALDIALFVDKNDWNATQVFNKADFSYSDKDEFNEKITSSEVWYVEWEQQIYISNN